MQTSLALKSLVSSHAMFTFSTCFKSIPSKNTKDGFSSYSGKTIFVFTPSMEIRGVSCSPKWTDYADYTDDNDSRFGQILTTF